MFSYYYFLISTISEMHIGYFPASRNVFHHRPTIPGMLTPCSDDLDHPEIVLLGSFLQYWLLDEQQNDEELCTDTLPRMPTLPTNQAIAMRS